METSLKRKKPARIKIIIAVILLVFAVGGIEETVRRVMQEGVSSVYIAKNALLVVLMLAIAVYLFIDRRRTVNIDKLITGGMTKVEEIARSAGVPYTKTEKIINKLIDKGFYTDLSFDAREKELVRKMSNQS